jgi:hypothetical protein
MLLRQHVIMEKKISSFFKNCTINYMSVKIMNVVPKESHNNYYNVVRQQAAVVMMSVVQ